MHRGLYHSTAEQEFRISSSLSGLVPFICGSECRHFVVLASQLSSPPCLSYVSACDLFCLPVVLSPMHVTCPLLFMAWNISCTLVRSLALLSS